MEYIIILFLLIFLILIIFIKQIKSINKFIEKENNIRPILSKNYNYYLFSPFNPIILHFYEKLYLSFKKINKYNYKSYIIFNHIKLSSYDRIYLDWISYTSGIIKMAIDTIIKYIKKKNVISIDFVKKLNQLKLYYTIFYEKIDSNKIIKNIKKNHKNKNIQSNPIIYNLYFIDYILNNIYSKYFNHLKESNNISKNIIDNLKNINHNKYYLYNSILNNKINKKYIYYNYSKFVEYFETML